MTDALVAQKFDTVEKPPSTGTARFYVVSKRKFITLFVVTLGLYAVYWQYKQWSCFKEATPFGSDEADIWPVMRAIFGIFFVHALFRKVKEHSRAGTALDGWEHRSHATLLVVIMLISQILDRAAWRNIGSPVTDYLSLAMIAPLLYYYYNAQAMINISCGDAEGAENSRFTTANYIWIGLGAIFWLLILVGLVLPDDPT